MSARDRARRSERGAVAVEFALVMPLVFMMLFGVLDYGLFFDNSLSVRHGAREAARQGVVETAPAGACASVSADYLPRLACAAKAAIGPLAGTAYVKTFYTSWTTGQQLTVCAMVQISGVVGMVPFPAGGWSTARTDMSIEVTDPVPAGVTSYADTLPAGQSWAWCS